MRLKVCERCGRPFLPRHSRQRGCPEHEQHGRALRSPTTRAQDAEYAAERKRVLVPGARCHWCPALATTADHLLAVANGGGHRGNLVPCCARCNASKQAGDAPKTHRDPTAQHATADQLDALPPPCPPTAVRLA